MANTSRIKGFRPLFHTNGAPYNGQFNVYQHASGDSNALFVGDVVKLAGDASAGGIATVTISAGGSPALGVVVGFAPQKTDPIAGSLNTGSLSLDTPQYCPASTAMYVYVCDSPDVVYEVEGTNAGSSYTYLSADIGLNADGYYGTAGSTSTGNSGMSLDVGGTKATTATLQFKILGASQRVDNETVNSSSTAVKYLAKINNATLGNGTGATGQ